MLIINTNSNKTLYFSNTYDLFRKMNTRFTNQQVNQYLYNVYHTGKRVRIRELQYGYREELLLFGNELFFFLVNDRYKLAFDYAIAADQKENEIAYNEIALDSNQIGSFKATNTYDAFLNYAKLHSLKIRSDVNDPLFRDFEHSLHTLNFNIFHKDDSLGFMSVPNVNRGQNEYRFHFIVYGNFIIITDYTKDPSTGSVE